MDKKVLVFLAPGFEEIEAITPVDVLRRAGANVKLVSINNILEVEGAHHIIIKADCTISEVNFDQTDVLFLPGGMPGANNLNGCVVLKQKIEVHFQQGKTIAAICAAPFIIGEMGLLNGHKATCYPGFESRLLGADVTSNPVEVSLPFITGNGVGAVIEFSLKLVSLLYGKAKADELAAKMVVN